MDIQKSIIVTTEFEGIHSYKDAPEEVSFLASPHRHIFKIKAKIEVFHDDRELEFILVKRDLQDFCKRWYGLEQCGSCEMIAGTIIEYLSTRWPILLEKKLELDRMYMHRCITVEVWEDNENGAELIYVPEIEHNAVLALTRAEMLKPETQTFITPFACPSCEQNLEVLIQAKDLDQLAEQFVINILIPEEEENNGL